MEFVMLAISILILLVLIVKFKLNTFVSLVVTAFILALLLGMNPMDVPNAVLGDQGMGNILGSNLSYLHLRWYDRSIGCRCRWFIPNREDVD